jgi:hypothetical protein
MPNCHNILKTTEKIENPFDIYCPTRYIDDNRFVSAVLGYMTHPPETCRWRSGRRVSAHFVLGDAFPPRNTFCLADGSLSAVGYLYSEEFEESLWM